jgi:hypothetical protein
MVLFFAGVAIAGTRDPGVSDQRYIDYGSQFTCVGKLECRDSDGRDAVASCVAIDPHWVVTAAHVVAGSTNVTILVSGKSQAATEIVVRDGFRCDCVGCCDIALARVGEDIGLPFYPGLYGQADEAGKVVAIAGYGMTGTLETGHLINDGQRRAGSNIVDHIGSKGLLICSAGSGVGTELEFLIAPGDSGGGLFIGNSLAGINSLVMASKRSPQSRYGDESGHVRISQHLEWIREQLARTR